MAERTTVESSTVALGGEDGAEPGAGGGGGGAIGPGASGGRGGRGGDVHEHGVGPGMGGDGGSVSGEGRIGFGGGGAGGFFHYTTSNAAKSYKIDIGRGGLPGSGPVHGGDGEPVTITDGDTGEVVALSEGGKGGRPGYRGLQPREASLQDIENGLRVPSVYLADAVQLKHNLINALGAGGEYYVVSQFPAEMNVLVVFAVSLNAIGPQGNLLLSIDVVDMTNRTLTTRKITASSGEERPVMRPNFWVSMQFAAKEPGAYQVVVKSGDFELGILPFEIRADH